MKVEELFEFNVEKEMEQDPNTGRYDPEKDELRKAKLTDKRKKNRLTLRKLNRLKKIRAVKKLEAIKRQKLYGVIYGKPKEEEGGGGPGGPF